MRTSTITSVVIDDNPMRCITACAHVKPDNSDLTVRGVTDSASDEIRKLVLDAVRRRGFNLPNGAITVSLDFDVPFEKTSELAFAALLALYDYQTKMQQVTTGCTHNQLLLATKSVHPRGVVF